MTSKSCISCHNTCMVTLRGTCVTCELTHASRKEHLDSYCPICKKPAKLIFNECESCSRSECRKKPCVVCKGKIEADDYEIADLCQRCNEKAAEVFKKT